MRGIASELGGQTRASLDWEREPGRPQRFTVRLEGGGLHASLLRRQEKRPFRVALAQHSMAARLEASRDVLSLREGEISDGRITLRAKGSLALPVARRAGLRLTKLALHGQEAFEIRRDVSATQIAQLVLTLATGAVTLRQGRVPLDARRLRADL